MPKKSTPAGLSCFLPLATLSFIACVALVAAVVGVPARVEATFGPASPRLGSTLRTILAVQLLWKTDTLTAPIDRFGTERLFRVEMGESVAVVAGHLQQQGLIADASAFRAYLQYAGLDTSLQAGEYHLSPAMTPVEIARALQDATPAEVTFTVLAGWRAEEIAAVLPTSGLNITTADFLAAVRTHPQGYSFSQEMPETALAEGYLFPGAYKVPRGTTASGLVSVLLNGFETQVLADIRQGFANQGLTLHEGVTLASIVEREAIQDDEMPTIASVFFNRLGIGMKLDSDPTVQYALGFNVVQNTWWTNPLSATDLQINSPYNTYLYPGLPPGPICNPGLNALRAVASPEQTSYFYFRAACDHSGRHLFAETFEQHKQNACP